MEGMVQTAPMELMELMGPTELCHLPLLLLAMAQTAPMELMEPTELCPLLLILEAELSRHPHNLLMSIITPTTITTMIKDAFKWLLTMLLTIHTAATNTMTANLET